MLLTLMLQPSCLPLQFDRFRWSVVERVIPATMASVLQPVAAVLQPVASVLEKAHHYSKPALSPTFVNVFIPLSAALGLIFAIWYAASL